MPWRGVRAMFNRNNDTEAFEAYDDATSAARP